MPVGAAASSYTKWQGWNIDTLPDHDLAPAGDLHNATINDCITMCESMSVCIGFVRHCGIPDTEPSDCYMRKLGSSPTCAAALSVTKVTTFRPTVVHPTSSHAQNPKKKLSFFHPMPYLFLWWCVVFLVCLFVCLFCLFLFCFCVCVCVCFESFDLPDGLHDVHTQRVVHILKSAPCSHDLLRASVMNATMLSIFS
jgi:hypothetical protein